MTIPVNITLETSLQCFFFDELSKLNKKMHKPLPNEVVYYASRVMDSFGKSNAYFEESNGRVKDKILGEKLLKATLKSKTEQKRELKDIGDTALLLCGYFSKSIENKIIDSSYYFQIGSTAYSRLNSFVPSLYDVPSFYKLVADSFVPTVNIISVVAEQVHQAQNEDQTLILNLTSKTPKAS